MFHIVSCRFGSSLSFIFASLGELFPVHGGSGQEGQTVELLQEVPSQGWEEGVQLYTRELQLATAEGAVNGQGEQQLTA